MRIGPSLAAALLLAAMMAAPVVPRADDVYVAWISFHEAYEAFTRYPSSENASAARSLLPDTSPVSRRKREWESNAVAFVASNLDILEREVEARNRDAVRLTYRLGVLGEEFVDQTTYMILGKLIRIDPQLFLEELHAHQRQVGSLDGLVSTLGPEYIGREQASCLELARRIGALEAVESEHLAPLRRSSTDALLTAMRKRC